VVVSLTDGELRALRAAARRGEPLGTAAHRLVVAALGEGNQEKEER
jgi:hypothetical protein